MGNIFIEVVPTNPNHVLELRGNLREEDASEICKFGLSIRKALYRSYRNSIITKTAIVDNKVAAIWGLSGVLLGEEGHPWLLTSPIVEKYPLHFALCYRKEVREMLHHFPVLANYVDASYTKSVRLLELIGFQLDDPMPIKGLKSRALFRRFHMEGSQWA